MACIRTCAISHKLDLEWHTNRANHPGSEDGRGIKSPWVLDAVLGSVIVILLYAKFNTAFRIMLSYNKNNEAALCLIFCVNIYRYFVCRRFFFIKLFYLGH
jgi:hypothetical protein